MGKKLKYRGGQPPSMGLADALFGRVRQRVLGLLLGHPGRSFYTGQIIEWVDAGSGAVQRELARLETVGLVTAKRIGRQKHYQANEKAPIFPELRGIILKTTGLRDVLRDALTPLLENIKLAFVFGSMAKGADSTGSDVDLMVVTDHLTYAELFTALEAASSSLARTINPTIYTSEEFARRVRQQHPFLTKVLDQPRIWIQGGDDDLSP